MKKSCRHLLDWLYKACHKKFGEYPIEILPTSKFHLCLNINGLDSKYKIALIRRSLRNEEDTFNDSGIKARAILPYDQEVIPPSYKDIFGLSLNLLGGLFLKVHCAFSTKGKGSNYWKKKEDVWFWSLRKSFQREVDNVDILFQLNSLNGVNVPYTIRNRDLCKQYGLIKGDEPFKNRGTLVVEHKPTLLNYWHVELHFNENINGVSKRIKRNSYKRPKSPSSINHKHEIAQLILVDILCEEDQDIEFEQIMKVDYFSN